MSSGARQLRVSIDQLKLSTSWDADRLSNAALTVTVGGLMLQGASFDGSQLTDAASNANEITGVPDVTFAYIHKDDAPAYREGDAISAPIYLTTSREKHLVEVDIPKDTDEGASKWTMASVALFLSDEQ